MLARVDVAAVLFESKIEVRAGGTSGRAHAANQRILMHALAFLHQARGEMQVSDW